MTQPSVRLWVKYTVFFVNILFLVLGGVLISVGVWGIISKSAESIAVLSDQIGISLDPFYVFLIIGALVFVIALIGAIGSLRENTCLLKTYSGVLIIFLLLEIVLGILVFVFQDNATAVLGTVIDRAIRHYRDNADTQYVVDIMQGNLACCGVTSPDDWQVNVYFNCSSIAASKCSVPFSCCIQDPAASGVPNYQCGYGILTSPESEWYAAIFTTGCVDAFKRIFLENAVVLGITGGVMIVAQVIVICLARMLIEDIDDVKRNW